ncbi:MAG TPA: hypothetical protein IAA57_04595 [Candidatus Pullilachnospira intestinigallinarum]|nr:hypothetical protein [Candidatus Pullilachnospira intestinigallinarum]
MNQWRDKLIRFMTGRYGVDDLGKATLAGAIVLLVLAMLFRSSLLNLLALALIVYGYFRILSRNISARYEENQKYLRLRSRVLGGLKGQRTGADRTMKVFRCPTCGQKVRVPRGKGRISIHCPKCNTDFIKRT